MSNEELLIQRYKVIAIWPGSRFEVGEILYKYFFETSKTGMYTYVTNTESPLQGHSAKKEDVEAMPHLFKPLQWWEERKPEEMPEYVKWESGKVTNVIRWKDGCDFCKVMDHTYFVSSAFFIPATAAEYEAYLQTLTVK